MFCGDTASTGQPVRGTGDLIPAESLAASVRVLVWLACCAPQVSVASCGNDNENNEHSMADVDVFVGWLGAQRLRLANLGSYGWLGGSWCSQAEKAAVALPLSLSPQTPLARSINL